MIHRFISGSVKDFVGNVFDLFGPAVQQRFELPGDTAEACPGQYPAALLFCLPAEYYRRCGATPSPRCRPRSGRLPPPRGG